MDTKLVYWVWLTRLFEFSSGRIAPIYYKFSPQEAYFASLETLTEAGVREEDALLLQNKNLDEARRIIEKCEKLGIKIVTANSPLYPRRLERLKDKPYVLYVKGSLDCLKKKTAALVGTRRTSIKGKELGFDIAKRLISQGYTLMSGGADGIDSIGAKASLEGEMPFCIVSGVDIDKYYPAANKGLIDKVAESGVVISEYPPDACARYFPTRNRIIAGLSDEVYIAEAPEGSGALITADFAKALGIRVYAGLGEGCRELVEKGAVDLVGKKEKKTRVKKEPTLTGTNLYIYERLKKSPCSENELVDGEHSIADILIALTELELDGIIKPREGKYKLI